MELPIIDAYDRARNVQAKPYRAACYAPFTSMVLDTTGVVRVCCVNHAYPLGDLRTERLREIWTGGRMERLRQAMRDYDFSLGCQQCEWKISQGGFEGKTLANSTLMPYKFEHLSLAAEGPLMPRHLEFHVSNTCNLACATCWGEYSSIIRSKREGLPPLPKVYEDTFFEDLKEFLPHLEEAQFLGGEPFLIREHQRIWDMLIEKHLTPRCHITTNGTQFNDRVQRICDSLPVSLSVSIDGATKKTFEQIRINAKYEVVMANLQRFADICRAKETAINIIFTLSRLNWFELGDILLLAEDMGIVVSVVQLWEPKRFSLFSLSSTELTEIVQKLESRDSELQSRLALNLRTWTTQLHELAEHCRGLTARAAESKSAALPVLGRQDLESPSEAASRSFLASIRDWAVGLEPATIRHDGNFQITAVQAEGTSCPYFNNDLIGKPVDDFIVALKRAVGSRVHVLEEQHSAGGVIRLVQFINDANQEATLVRVGMFQDQPGEPGIIVLAGRKKLDSRLDFGVAKDEAVSAR